MTDWGGFVAGIMVGLVLAIGAVLVTYYAEFTGAFAGLNWYIWGDLAVGMILGSFLSLFLYTVIQSFYKYRAARLG